MQWDRYWPTFRGWNECQTQRAACRIRTRRRILRRWQRASPKATRKDRASKNLLAFRLLVLHNSLDGYWFSDVCQDTTHTFRRDRGHRDERHCRGAAESWLQGVRLRRQAFRGDAAPGGDGRRYHGRPWPG